MADEIGEVIAAIRRIVEEELPPTVSLEDVVFAASDLTRTPFAVQIRTREPEIVAFTDEHTYRIMERIRERWPPDTFLLSFKARIVE